MLAVGSAVDEEIDLDGIDDDVLALMFRQLPPGAVSRGPGGALTLRMVGGLSSAEIARASVPTVQVWITRGRKTIAEASVPFELPPAAEHLRPDVAYEAIRLARMSWRAGCPPASANAQSCCARPPR